MGHKLYMLYVGTSQYTIETAFAIGEHARDRAMDKLAAKYPDYTVTAQELDNVYQ